MVVAGVGTRPDADLLAAAAEGDEAASDELFRRHHTAVLRYARGLVRDQHLAEDLTSEAFTRTFAAMRQGGGPRDACRPYLYTVVRNTATDWARGARRTVVTDEVADWARGARRTVVTDEVADWASDSDAEAPDVDELDALVRAFRSLPERWQTVLWYTLIEDEPVGQVAELLGMEKGAVSQLAFRAREGLRQAFLVAGSGGRPECAEFTAQLAASVRRPGRRRSRALRRHLESCEECGRASKETADLNGRLRRALPVGAALLGAPSASLGPLGPSPRRRPCPAGPFRPRWPAASPPASRSSCSPRSAAGQARTRAPHRLPRRPPPRARPRRTSPSPTTPSAPEPPEPAAGAREAAVATGLAQAPSACATRRCNRAWHPAARRSCSAPAPTRRRAGGAGTPPAASR
ncbi:sigma-70 family RNA polymerase sigma factor [Spirillospora sp. CA-108201]